MFRKRIRLISKALVREDLCAKYRKVLRGEQKDPAVGDGRVTRFERYEFTGTAVGVRRRYNTAFDALVSDTCSERISVRSHRQKFDTTCTWCAVVGEQPGKKRGPVGASDRKSTEIRAEGKSRLPGRVTLFRSVNVTDEGRGLLIASLSTPGASGVRAIFHWRTRRRNDDWQPECSDRCTDGRKRRSWSTAAANVETVSSSDRSK